MPAKTNNKTISGECEPYQLDLTDYVTGDMTFLTKEKQQQLFDHLKQCAKCRQDFFDWEETFGVLVTKQHHSKAEVKKRMDDLIEQLKRELVSKMPVIELLPGAQVLDDQAEIDKAAGAVWRHLAKNGWVKVKDLSQTLKREAKLHPDAIKFGVGWLIHEKKVHLAEKKKNTYVYLNETERKIYQAQV